MNAGSPGAWLGFIGLYVVSNRLVAIPGGIYLGLPSFAVATATFALDVAQIAIYDWIFHHGGRMLRAMRGLHATEEKISHAHWLTKYGHAGVGILSAIPTFGGGIWSAVLLARHFRMKPAEKYAWIAAGSFAGVLAVLGPAKGVLAYLR